MEGSKCWDEAEDLRWSQTRKRYKDYVEGNRRILDRAKDSRVIAGPGNDMRIMLRRMGTGVD